MRVDAVWRLKETFLLLLQKNKNRGEKNKGFLASWAALVLGFTISCILVSLAAEMEKSQGERADTGLGEPPALRNPLLSPPGWLWSQLSADC